MMTMTFAHFDEQIADQLRGSANTANRGYHRDPPAGRGGQRGGEHRDHLRRADAQRH